MRYQISNIELFQEMLKAIPLDDACMEWPRGRHKRGYGKIWHDGERKKTHQLAYELTKGPIPEGHGVLHKCDNPPCFRPDHLFTGTQEDNVRDAVSKGRWSTHTLPASIPRPKGERNANSVLTENLVREIRALHAATGMKFSPIGRKFGVSPTTIEAVVRRKTWKHVI